MLKTDSHLVLHRNCRQRVYSSTPTCTLARGVTDASLMQASIHTDRWGAARGGPPAARHVLQIDAHSHALIHAEVFTHRKSHLFSCHRASTAFPRNLYHEYEKPRNSLSVTFLGADMLGTLCSVFPMPASQPFAKRAHIHWCHVILPSFPGHPSIPETLLYTWALLRHKFDSHDTRTGMNEWGKRKEGDIFLAVARMWSRNRIPKVNKVSILLKGLYAN